MSEALEFMRKWLFVPWEFKRSDGVRIIVSDIDEKKNTFTRELSVSDFCFNNDKVPNYGMLTYVGISEVIKKMESLEQELKDKTEALEDSNYLLKSLRAGEDWDTVEDQVKENQAVLAKYPEKK